MFSSIKISQSPFVIFISYSHTLRKCDRYRALKQKKKKEEHETLGMKFSAKVKFN